MGAAGAEANCDSLVAGDLETAHRLPCAVGIWCTCGGLLRGNALERNAPSVEKIPECGFVCRAAGPPTGTAWLRGVRPLSDHRQSLISASGSHGARAFAVPGQQLKRPVQSAKGNFSESRANRFPADSRPATLRILAIWHRRGRRKERGANFEGTKAPGSERSSGSPSVDAYPLHSRSGSPSSTSLLNCSRHLQNGRRTHGDRPACSETDRQTPSTSQGASPITYGPRGNCWPRGVTGTKGRLLLPPITHAPTSSISLRASPSR
jgi:hypothetical protein